MAAPAVKLTFTDGRTEEVRLNPRVMVEVERKYGLMDRHAIEGTLYGAWFRLGRQGSFEDFIDSVESMDGDGAGVAVPTVPGASDGSS